MRWSDELPPIERTVREAGRLLQRLAAHPPAVLSDTGRDIKLQADRDAEKLIVAALREVSTRPILAEESGEHGEDFDGLFWVVDPLDGTVNFSRGIPVCCVSLALMEGARPRAGAIYDFSRDELFSAADGAGARLNGRPIRVSGVRDPAQGILTTGFPAAADYSTGALMPLVGWVQAFKKVRMIGAAAVSLAWGAAGRMDAYAEDGVMLWDIAAGMLLVREAGGHVEVGPAPSGKWSRRIRCASDPRLWAGLD